jgi:hypothetical protein
MVTAAWSPSSICYAITETPRVSGSIPHLGTKIRQFLVNLDTTRERRRRLNPLQGLSSGAGRVPMPTFWVLAVWSIAIFIAGVWGLLTIPGSNAAIILTDGEVAKTRGKSVTAGTEKKLRNLKPLKKGQSRSHTNRWRGSFI